MALAANQAGLAEDLEVLRERGLWNRLIAHDQEVRTVLRAHLGRDVDEHRHPHRIGQGMQNSLYRNVLDGWMEQGSHVYKSRSHRQKVQ